MKVEWKKHIEPFEAVLVVLALFGFIFVAISCTGCTATESIVREYDAQGNLLKKNLYQRKHRERCDGKHEKQDRHCVGERLGGLPVRFYRHQRRPNPPCKNVGWQGRKGGDFRPTRTAELGGHRTDHYRHP